jgi:predicted dithiol-disulfide oxidoreductase (DUF899 family)
MNRPKIASQAEWLAARKALLAKEKAFTRERDALSAARRELPMVKVEKRYVFDGAAGQRTLAELFDGKRQLVVYHFMFDPSWDEGCKSCSFIADGFDGILPHLGARDTAFAAVSRAPFAKLVAFQKRMGWAFPWLSSGPDGFNMDFAVSFTPEEVQARTGEYNFVTVKWQRTEGPGLSTFLRGEGDDVFHTYSMYGRGVDALMLTYQYLDLTPLGRNEAEGRGMAWLKHHDRYAP